MSPDTQPNTADRAELMRAQFTDFFDRTDGLDTQAKRHGQLFLDICAGGAVTRKRLVDAHGIRPGTVSAIVTRLIDQGLVTEERPQPPYQQGRPEILLRPVFERISVIVIHVISREVQAVLVDLAGRILCDHGHVVEVDEADNENLEKLFHGLIAIMHEQAPARTKIVGIAFSLPGIIDEEGLNWAHATTRWPKVVNLGLAVFGRDLNIPVAANKNLHSELRARLARRANERPGGTLIAHWGYGIGAAFAIDGNIITTSNGGFGQIGHWVVAPASKNKCLCGQYGCLETEAALWALLPDLRKNFPDTPAEEWSFETFLRDHDIDQLPSLIQATEKMALALHNLIMALFPHRLVLTGPFPQDRRIFERFCAELQAKTPAFAPANVEVRVGRPGPEDEILGAALPLLQSDLARLAGAS